MRHKNYKIRCACCKDELEIFVVPGQVIFDFTIPEWPFWWRVRHALGLIFHPTRFKAGGGLWIEPKKFKKLIEKINNDLNKL